MRFLRWVYSICLRMADIGRPESSLSETHFLPQDYPDQRDLDRLEREFQGRTKTTALHKRATNKEK